MDDAVGLFFFCGLHHMVEVTVGIGEDKKLHAATAFPAYHSRKGKGKQERRTMLRPSFVLLAVLAALIGLGSVAGGIGVVGVAGILLVGVIVIFAHKRILLSWDLRIVSAGRKKLCMQEKGVEKLGCIHYNILRENAIEKI